ncbi:transglycosylase SLT domain-containing protein [Serratia liquefaciens]|uniref:transglycosylase SLT domain-containing protein n=1 Tax=Serratia liquefaciens TaxID=614 RepID=UPI0032DF1E76
MKAITLALALSLFATEGVASDCYSRAGRDYKIDPDLLQAIDFNESSYRDNAIGTNQSIGYGVGRMQIDSQNFPHLSQFGITPEKLVADPCLNIYTGAYYLAIAFKRWGVNWRAVGAYNAGFSTKKPIHEELRQVYAKKIYITYRQIKAKKNQLPIPKDESLASN